MRRMSFVLTFGLAVSLVCPSVACTTIVYVQAPETTEATSVPPSEPDTETDSTTREPETSDASSSSGGTGTGSTTAASDEGTATDGSSSDTTSSGSTSEAATDTEAAYASTSEAGTTGQPDTTGTTGEPPPVPSKQLGEECVGDSECVSGWCSNNLFDQEAPQTCTQACVPGADACSVGLCVDVGNDTFRCSGAWPVKSAAIVQPPYQTSFYAAANGKPVKEIGVFYVDPQPVSYVVEVSAINNPGYGPAVIDVFTAKGAPLGTAVANKPVQVLPSTEYVVLAVHASTDAQTLANVSLK